MLSASVECQKRAQEELYGTQANLYVGVQVADGATAGKNEQNPSQISRDHDVTRSLLYVWWQLYRERGEAGLRPTQAFGSPPEVDRPQNAQEQIAYLEWLCG
jgi:Helix-turn-helix domain